MLDGGAFNTVENVTLSSSRASQATVGTGTAITGTRGIWLKVCRHPLGRLAIRRSRSPACAQALPLVARPRVRHAALQGAVDCVINNFQITSVFAYELTLSGFALGNVVANGRCADGTLEFSHGAAYGNLVTNVHLGTGSKPFGWVARGQDASGLNVFWNVRTSNDSIVLPPAGWAPASTFVHAEGAAAVRNRAVEQAMLLRKGPGGGLVLARAQACHAPHHPELPFNRRAHLWLLHHSPQVPPQCHGM